MRPRALRKAQADESPMNFEGVFVFPFLNLKARQEREARGRRTEELIEERG
jgi:hypothetical protein